MYCIHESVCTCIYTSSLAQGKYILQLHVCTYVRMYNSTTTEVLVRSCHVLHTSIVRTYVCTYVRMYVCTYVRTYVRHLHGSDYFA